MPSSTTTRLLVNGSDTYDAQVWDLEQSALQETVPVFSSDWRLAILPTGEICAASWCLDADPPRYRLRVFDRNAALVAEVDVGPYGDTTIFRGVAAGPSQTFYWAARDSAVAESVAVIGTISTAGVVGATTWTLGADSGEVATWIQQIAVSADQSTLWWANEQIINRYDLIHSIPLTPLAYPELSVRIWGNMIRLADDTLIVAYSPGSSSLPIVVRYASNGVIASTFTDPE
jgi:hypothetical protein